MFEHDEVIESVIEAFEDDGRLSLEYMDISFIDDVLTINGRVSSEEELQIVDEILQDVLEIDEYKNSLWVDDSLDFDNTNGDEEDMDKKISLDDDSDIDDQDYSESEDEDYDS